MYNQGQTKNRTVVIPKKREGIRHLYFTVDAASGRERYFEYHPKCMVTLRDSRFARGATLHGEVEIGGGGLGSDLCRLPGHSARG
ncbi:MAG: hypothetical protein LIO46_06570 [Clostridiales bacterium]|nr:hypothetical protein [Clostridiales bacterium]